MARATRSGVSAGGLAPAAPVEVLPLLETRCCSDDKRFVRSAVGFPPPAAAEVPPPWEKRSNREEPVADGCD